MRKKIKHILISVLIGAICFVSCNLIFGISESDGATGATTVPPPQSDDLVEACEIEESEPVELSEESENVETITFRVTAYCACEQCCGVWANNRPLDSNGNPIVKGAAGTRLISNISCASPLPFGTKIELEDWGYVEVADRTADWVVDEYGKYILDVYMADHQAALDFGVKHLEGVIL